MVGTARFELATPCTPSKCATRLRYVPNGIAASARQRGVLTFRFYTSRRLRARLCRVADRPRPHFHSNPWDRACLPLAGRGRPALHSSRLYHERRVMTVTSLPRLL